MSKLVHKYIDVIQELADDTINNPNFNFRQYCLWDVERLRKIADLIERAILENE